MTKIRLRRIDSIRIDTSIYNIIMYVSVDGKVKIIIKYNHLLFAGITDILVLWYEILRA